jgi:DNA-binding MarR family transcriptional regulator
LRKSTEAEVATQRVGQLLFEAAQAAQALATEQLMPLALSARGWGLLRTLVESGPLTQIELATRLAVDRTAMVYLIDELEETGLVRRVRNPDDRRAFLINLTEKGRVAQREGANALSSARGQLLAPLDVREREQLTLLLVRIIDHWQDRRK